MFKDLVKPIVWLDALIQRHVDACVHAIMRKTGCRKATIRWSLNVVSTGLAIAEVAVNHNWLWICTSGLTLAVTYQDAYYDRKWEPLGVDPRFGSPMITFLKTCIALGTVACVLNQSYIAMMFNVVLLLQMYVHNTSPRVPPKKEERELALVPEHA